jgi:MEMO1 family protein
MKVKRSTLGGSWYSADPAELRQQIDRWIDESSGTQSATMAVIVPHAGYQYSGTVAAAAYRRLRDCACTRVVIMAPSHRMAFRGVVVLDADAFSTPLGLVEVDMAAAKLADGGLVRSDSRPFADEHSLEIQLPFVQRVLPGAKVVPLLFGDMGSADFGAFVSVLAGLADDQTVFAVSSDFTHYGWRFGYEPFPAESADAVRTGLRDLDMGAIRPVLEGDAQAFARYLDSTGATVCGRVPVTAFLTWAGPSHHGELVAYRTSLDITGDYSHVVSYAGITFPRS